MTTADKIRATRHPKVAAIAYTESGRRVEEIITKSVRFPKSLYLRGLAEAERSNISLAAEIRRALSRAWPELEEDE